MSKRNGKPSKVKDTTAVVQSENRAARPTGEPVVVNTLGSADLAGKHHPVNMGVAVAETRELLAAEGIAPDLNRGKSVVLTPAILREIIESAKGRGIVVSTPEQALALYHTRKGTTVELPSLTQAEWDALTVSEPGSPQATTPIHSIAEGVALHQEHMSQLGEQRAAMGDNYTTVTADTPAIPPVLDGSILTPAEVWDAMAEDAMRQGVSVPPLAKTPLELLGAELDEHGLTLVQALKNGTYLSGTSAHAALLGQKQALGDGAIEVELDSVSQHKTHDDVFKLEPGRLVLVQFDPTRIEIGKLSEIFKEKYAACNGVIIHGNIHTDRADLRRIRNQAALDRELIIVLVPAMPQYHQADFYPLDVEADVMIVVNELGYRIKKWRKIGGEFNNDVQKF